jgi:hypothetical protein
LAENRTLDFGSGLVVAVFTALVVSACDKTTSHDPQRGMTYESLRELPAITGYWYPLTPPFVLPPVQTPAVSGAEVQTQPSSLADRLCALRVPKEVRPEIIARCRLLAEQLLAHPGDRGYCAKQKFNGRPPAGAGGSVEVLFTPGQVTMSTASGLVRRVYLRNELPADALQSSTTGTSIGHWQDAVLVVETSGLDPTADFILGSGMGNQSLVRERITLQDPDTLQIESTLTAPDLLTAPVTMQQQYHRARDHVYTEFDTCNDADRSFDRSTGQERFDTTPPADLPPPPAD